jgi:outer membrane protein
MKNLSYIINGILAVAVIVLYVLYFSGKCHKSQSANPEANAQSLKGIDGGIVYVNIDSVLTKYEMNIEIQRDLQGKVAESEKQLNKKQDDLRKAYTDFQDKASRHLITQAEGEQTQQKLQQEEQDLYALQNDLRTKLSEEEQVAQRKVLNSIMVYLESLESTKNHQYVLGTTFGGNVLYANKSLNISDVVIEGLNKQYKSEKNK